MPIPDVAFPERQGSEGPAVVFDTKGEVYHFVAPRHQALKRRVVYL